MVSYRVLYKVGGEMVITSKDVINLLLECAWVVYPKQRSLNSSLCCNFGSSWKLVLYMGPSILTGCVVMLPFLVSVFWVSLR